MRGKLTRSVLAGLAVLAVVLTAAREGPTVAAGVLALMLGGIALIQVGAHEPRDRS